MNFLVVDDCKINQKVLKLKLEKLGYSVVVANNGQEAIDIISKNNNVNVIFMDLVMPILNGFDASKIIKNELKFTGKIIGLSGNENIINQFKNYCLDDFLLKPIDYSNLHKYILNLN
jgi:CheY-like chemotaxis protein